MAQFYQGTMVVDLSINFCSLHCGNTKTTSSHKMELLEETASVLAYITHMNIFHWSRTVTVWVESGWKVESWRNLDKAGVGSRRKG